MTVDVEKQQENHRENAERDGTPSFSAAATAADLEADSRRPGNFEAAIRRLFASHPLTADQLDANIRKEKTTCVSEISLDRCIPGYPKLSGYMGLTETSMIFRRFGALNAQNLLYMQAELISLERQLRETEQEDHSTEGGHVMKRFYSQDWFSLSMSKEDGDDHQWQIVQRIRKLLREYNEALTHANAVLALPEPGPTDLKDIQDFLSSDRMGRFGIAGIDHAVWGSKSSPKSHAADLVALRPRDSDDAFSHWVTNKAIRYADRLGLFRNKKADAKLGEVVLAEDKTLLQITYILTSIVAALLPVASIVVLIYVRNTPARLAVIGGFNLLVSFSLTFFTSAKRTDVFAVTAAFAAVQVVFVGVNQ